MNRSAQQYKDLGIPSWFHDHARYYERLFTNIGWNEKQITEALKFGANYQGDGSEADLTRQFKDLAVVIDAPDVDMALDVGLGLRDNITMNGLEALPALSGAESTFSTADQDRLAEIRQTIRDDPSAYDRLQGEQLALLEAQQASGGKASPGNANASVSPAGDRLSQIRDLRRNDPRAYDNDASIQTEELQLIEASLPKPAPVSTGSDGASTSQATSEGTP